MSRSEASARFKPAENSTILLGVYDKASVLLVTGNISKNLGEMLDTGLEAGIIKGS